MRLVGLLLLVLGILGVTSGGFSYRKEKGDAKIGPIAIEVTEKKRLDVPRWSGIAAIVVGGILLFRRT
jgi:hypothetical protein